MKVKQLRLIDGCYALKATDNVIAKQDVTIERMINGDYLVTEYGKIVLVPHSQVKFAVCEETLEPEQRPSKVAVSDLKKL